MTDRQRLVLSYFDEDPKRSLAEIGRLVGCSRQAVTLTLNKFRPGWKSAHKKKTLAAKRPVDTKPCAVCGNPIAMSRRTCGGKCAKDWNSLRWHLDPKFRNEQRLRVARWNVKHPDKVTPAALKWAKKVLASDEPAAPSKWVAEGGTPSKYADRILGNE